jgi:tRNA threonylcarbamoyladenosine biosynthesis protein TsaE
LGAGKTVLVRGLARGLGTDPAVPVTSPSFTLIHEYPGPIPLYHFDFYRLSRAEEVSGVGAEEYFDGDGVCAIEWGDKFPALLPPATIELTLTPDSETGRTITLIPTAALQERVPDLAAILSNR